MTTKIEWCEKVWNPVTGCTRVSAGCDHCYAVAMTRRLAGMGSGKYRGLVDAGKKHFNGTVRCHEDVLELPLKWNKPQVIFVNSMSDLFHEGVPFEFIDKVFAVMAMCPQHTFIVLTKRAERMAEYCKRVAESKPHDEVNQAVFDAVNAVYGEFATFPLPNVWLGVSVEDQASADERIPWLLKCPAAVRLLSMEPLLGPVDLTRIPFGSLEYANGSVKLVHVNAIDNSGQSRINWVIVGGESGPGARPMHPDWARSIRDQCQVADVPFFFKQWGAWKPIDEPWKEDSPAPLAADQRFLNVAGGSGFHGEKVWRMRRAGKKGAGRLLDGRVWDERPNGNS